MFDVHLFRVRQVAPVGRNLTYHVFHNLLI